MLPQPRLEESPHWRTGFFFFPAVGERKAHGRGAWEEEGEEEVVVVRRRGKEVV